MKNKIGIEATATIETLSHDGRGIARIDGKATFIQGALPGEVVVFEYLRRKSGFDEGRMTSVVEASPHRVEPQCPHYSVCGACSLQHLAGAAQIIEKQALFMNSLQRIGHCQPESVLPPLSAAAWHYRNKARLSVRYVAKKQSVLVGFRERQNPRYIAEISQCEILNARVAAQLMALRELVAQLDDPTSIAQIEVAAGDEDVALIFRNLSSLSDRDEAKLVAFSETTGFRIYLQPSGPASVYLLHPTTASSYLTYRLPEANLTFQFYPTDFTQINAALNRDMIAQALDLLALDTNDVVLDLFCGLGNFSLPIAQHCKQVIGVEGSDAMVERASMNAQGNGILNATFYRANLDEESSVLALRKYPMTKLMLDPPRAGALAVVNQMDQLRPKSIVYVSCNPATLARDAGILVNEKGYRMKQAGVMDMFPHTEHVESIALFERE